MEISVMQSNSDDKWLSVYLVTSSAPQNQKFGTAFLIAHDETSSYFVTCAHVAIDLEKAILLAKNPAEVVAIDERAVDLCILRTSRIEGVPFSVAAEAKKGMRVETAGFQTYAKKFLRRPAIGTLGNPVALQSGGARMPFRAWDFIAEEEEGGLQVGFSGAPVCDLNSGKVVAILSHREGNQRGIAICARSLSILIPEFFKAITLASVDARQAMRDLFWKTGGRALAIAIIAIVVVFLLGRTSSRTSTILLPAPSAARALFFNDMATAQRLAISVDDILVPPDLKAQDWCGDWIRTLQRWLKERKEIAERLSAHRAFVASVKSIATKQEFDQITDLLEVYSHLLESEPVEIDEALERAQRIQARIADAPYDEAWTQAINSISSDPVYRGYVASPIKRQTALLPLRRDPNTGFWEFVDLLTGDAPPLEPDGHLRMTETSGMIYVLLPGGRSVQGATRHAEPGRLLSHQDPDAHDNESPIREVYIGSFFISKFELTQSQWRRLTGKTPSTFRTGLEREGVQFTGLFPVENLSWTEFDRLLTRLGARIPNEAEWEYAARGDRDGNDTGTIWWTGNDPEELPKVGTMEGMADGFKFDAPVGTFRPNRFGLYDTVGNVWEWCSDPYAADLSTRIPNPALRPFRGGSFGSRSDDVRTARRGFASTEFRYGLLGVRPARSLR